MNTTVAELVNSRARNLELHRDHWRPLVECVAAADLVYRGVEVRLDLDNGGMNYWWHRMSPRQMMLAIVPGNIRATGLVATWIWLSGIVSQW